MDLSQKDWGNFESSTSSQHKHIPLSAQSHWSLAVEDPDDLSWQHRQQKEGALVTKEGSSSGTVGHERTKCKKPVMGSL